MRKKRIAATLKIFLAVLSSFFVLTSLVGCTQAQSNPYKMQDFVMDTTLSQTIYSQNAEKISKEVLQAIKENDKIFSAFDKESEIYKINTAEGKEISVSNKTFNLIKKSLEFCRKSNGIFDISVFPLSKIWKDAISDSVLPKENEVKNALSLVDYKKIELNEENSSIKMPKNMALDLGAIAKGATLCDIYEIYDRNLVSGAICSIGNSAMLIYKNKNGKPFNIGLRNPFENGQNSLFATLSLENCTISTSGGYERYAEIEGEKYHHIIDIETGYPANNTMASATVVSSDGAESDYLSTRLFLLGFEKAVEVCKNEDISAVLVSNDKKIYVSSSLSDKIEITDKGFERIN